MSGRHKLGLPEQSSQTKPAQVPGFTSAQHVRLGISLHVSAEGIAAQPLQHDPTVIGQQAGHVDKEACCRSAIHGPMIP